MSTSQLSLYNGALRHLKERKLASLSENQETRRVLDDVWVDAIDFCLEQGLWKFAVRTAKFSANPDFTRSFGLQNQFEQPDDFLGLVALCSDEYFNAPLNRYEDEAGYWYADLTEIYVSYTSNDASYGRDFSKWPKTFVKYVEYYLASEAAPRLTNSNTDTEAMIKMTRRVLVDARSKDALKGPTKFMPQGDWVASRIRGPNNRRDGGNRGSLIG